MSNDICTKLKISIDYLINLPNLQGVAGTKLHVKGLAKNVPIEIDNSHLVESFYVVENMKQNILLGSEFMVKNSLILDFREKKV